jgi:hypothetical protein
MQRKRVGRPTAHLEVQLLFPLEKIKGSIVEQCLFGSVISISAILKIVFLKSYRRLIKHVKKYFFLSIECLGKISI